MATGGLVDRSGTITLGGTAQQAAAANTAREYLIVQNVSATDDLWVNFGVVAVADQPSVLLPKGGSSIVFEQDMVPTSFVSVIGATTGKSFVCKEG